MGRVRLFFFWSLSLCVFFFPKIEISFLWPLWTQISVSEGCSNFTFFVFEGEARAVRYKFDIFFAFDTSRYTYTTLLFILQRCSVLLLLFLVSRISIFLLLLLLFAQPTLDVVSIESDIFFKLGRGGRRGRFPDGDGLELDANVAGEARDGVRVVFGQVDDVHRLPSLSIFELEEDGEDGGAGFRGRERRGVDGDVLSFFVFGL